MTEYVLRTTIACPAALVDDANALALVLGETTDDDKTFGAPAWQDGDGNLYSVASTLNTATFQGRASGALIAPDHAPDADLVAAGRAQAVLVIATADAPVTAEPDKLTAWVGAATDSALDHLAALGLTRVEADL